MTNKRYATIKYTFTVEGQTEKLYFLWLQEQINQCESRNYNASVKVTIQLDPEIGFKRINGLTTQELFHICDVESNSQEDISRFHQILRGMKTVKKLKSIDYELGYSNFTFELWMILHKLDCNGSLNNKKQYLTFINRAFGEKFDNISQFKSEINFKRCLSKLNINDVKRAINRAEIISKNNKTTKTRTTSSGYTYYKDNPSLSVHRIVKRMIQECVGDLG